MNDEFEYQNIKFFSKVASKIYRRGNIYITEKLKPYHINYVQLMCLVSLYEHDGQRQDEITEEIGIDKASVNRAVQFLVKNEYITKVQNQTDKRAFNLFLTDKAVKFQATSLAILAKWQLMLSKDIDSQQLEIAFNVMKKMADNAEELYRK